MTERLTAGELEELRLGYDRHPNDGVTGVLLGKLIAAAEECERLRAAVAKYKADQEQRDKDDANDWRMD